MHVRRCCCCRRGGSAHSCCCCCCAEHAELLLAAPRCEHTCCCVPPRRRTGRARLLTAGHAVCCCCSSASAAAAWCTCAAATWRLLTVAAAAARCCSAVASSSGDCACTAHLPATEPARGQQCQQPDSCMHHTCHVPASTAIDHLRTHLRSPAERQQPPLLASLPRSSSQAAQRSGSCWCRSVTTRTTKCACWCAGWSALGAQRKNWRGRQRQAHGVGLRGGTALGVGALCWALCTVLCWALCTVLGSPINEFNGVCLDNPRNVIRKVKRGPPVRQQLPHHRRRHPAPRPAPPWRAATRGSEAGPCRRAPGPATGHGKTCSTRLVGWVVVGARAQHRTE